MRRNTHFDGGKYVDRTHVKCLDHMWPVRLQFIHITQLQSLNSGQV
jgi:hypothetical protein